MKLLFTQITFSFESSYSPDKPLTKKLKIIPNKFTKSVSLSMKLKGVESPSQSVNAGSFHKFKTLRSVGQSYYNKK